MRPLPRVLGHHPAGWVWPPVLLALAIWMGVRVRRSLAARSGRWALYPVVAVLAAAAGRRRRHLDRQPMLRAKPIVNRERLRVCPMSNLSLTCR